MAKKSVDEQSTAEYRFSTSSIGPQNVFPLWSSWFIFLRSRLSQQNLWLRRKILLLS